MKELNQEDCLPIIIRRIDKDTVEVRSRSYLMLMRWMLWLFVLFSLLYSVYGNLRYNNDEIMIFPLFFIEEQADWICCIDDVLRDEYSRISRYGRTFEEFKEGYNKYVYRAWGNLFFWALLLVPFILSNPRGVRFDRKRRLIYSVDGWGRFFATPFVPYIYPVQTDISSWHTTTSVNHPMRYLNSVITRMNKKTHPLVGWEIGLYQRKSNGKPRQMLKHLGAFPPTMANPYERHVLFEVLTEFMQGDDSHLQQIENKFKCHYYWVGRVLQFSPFGIQQFNEKKLKKQLANYEQQWGKLSDNEKNHYLDNIRKVTLGLSVSYHKGLILMVGYIVALGIWLFHYEKILQLLNLSV